MTILSSRPSRRAWVYSTSQFTRVREVDFELVREPASEVHAKEFGTTLTVCGRPAESWVRFWEMPFPSGRFVPCPVCDEIVAQRRRQA